MADDSPTYEFGLVMAGAISGGAYTAGVVDFLIQALDAWEALKLSDPASVPRHRALLKVVSGASAGAMTAAIAAVSLGSRVTPVTDVAAPPPPRENRLFDGWVRQIDLSKLLATGDLEGEGARLVSLLNAAVLRGIARSALDVDGLAQPRPAVADPLAVLLSVANLRGVPYAFSLFGDAGTRYGMLAHRDEVGFALSRGGAGLPRCRSLDPRALPEGGDWARLVDAALASGAFPVGLQPVLLHRPGSDYVGTYGAGPSWGPPPDDYAFLCVDGGLMNNEPFEAARRHLSGGAHQHNERQGHEARRGVVLIDPFPNTAGLDPAWRSDDRIVAVVQQMFGALVNQARFKPEELELAADPSCYSRFSISPSLRTDGGAPVEPAMAASVLGGFGGFIDESYRRHDFQLGRRNAQAFLRRHFCLPENNPLFAGLAAEVRERYYVRTRDGALDTEVIDGLPRPLLPIIPVVPPLDRPVPAPARPLRLADGRMQELERQVAARVIAVGRTFIDTELVTLGGTGLGGRAARFALGQAWRWHYAAKVTGEAVGRLRKAAATLAA